MEGLSENVWSEQRLKVKGNVFAFSNSKCKGPEAPKCLELSGPEIEPVCGRIVNKVRNDTRRVN